MKNKDNLIIKLEVFYFILFWVLLILPILVMVYVDLSYPTEKSSCGNDYGALTFLYRGWSVIMGQYYGSTCQPLRVFDVMFVGLLFVLFLSYWFRGSLKVILITIYIILTTISLPLQNYWGLRLPGSSFERQQAYDYNANISISNVNDPNQSFNQIQALLHRAAECSYNAICTSTNNYRPRYINIEKAFLPDKTLIFTSNDLTPENNSPGCYLAQTVKTSYLISQGNSECKDTSGQLWQIDYVSP